MDKHYDISDFARRIGRSASTVRRWERDGLLKNKRLPSGHRYFDEDDVRGILGKADEKRLTVVYCRVPSHGQKDDLQSQVSAMEQYCLGAGIASMSELTRIVLRQSGSIRKCARLSKRITRSSRHQCLTAARHQNCVKLNEKRSESHPRHTC